MSAWTGTRVPANTGAPLRMSGDEVTIGGATAPPYSPLVTRFKAPNAGAHRPDLALLAPAGAAACSACSTAYELLGGRQVGIDNDEKHAAGGIGLGGLLRQSQVDAAEKLLVGSLAAP